MFELPSLPQEMGEIVIQGLRLGRVAYRRLLNLATVIAFLDFTPTVVQLWGKGDDISFDTHIPTDWAAVLALLKEYQSANSLVVPLFEGLMLLPQIMLLRRIVFAVRGQKQPLAEELRHALQLWPWAILTAVVYALVVGFGCLLILIPGVILAVSLMFSQYAVALDEQKPLAALNSSHNLVWANWWRTVSMLAVVYVPVFLLVMILSSGLDIGVAPGQAVHARDIFKEAVLELVVWAFLLPFIYSIKYLYFHDLKLRRQAH